MTGYYITQEGTCEEICGDGMNIEPTHECDDGNPFDNDGCDSTCHLEPGYLCSGGGPSSRDICTRIITLSIKSVTISDEFTLTVQFNEVVEFNGKFSLSQISNYQTSKSTKMSLSSSMRNSKEVSNPSADSTAPSNFN